MMGMAALPVCRPHCNHGPRGPGRAGQAEPFFVAIWETFARMILSLDEAVGTDAHARSGLQGDIRCLAGSGRDS